MTGSRSVIGFWLIDAMTADPGAWWPLRSPNSLAW